jgi:bifunctional oligoribonuclease and PAP phosphatase NrnA
MWEQKIKHRVFNKKQDLPKNLDFLNRFSNITNKMPDFYDLVIYVDCGDKTRADIKIDSNIKSINIDHHASNDNFGDINITDETKSSTAEVLYHFFTHNNLKISKQIATCIYTGIFSDSLGFSTPRVDKDTFLASYQLVLIGVEPSYVADMLGRRNSLAKYRLLPLVLSSLTLYMEGKVGVVHVTDKWLEETGGVVRDIHDVVDMVLSIGVVKIAFLMRTSNNKTMFSLRSKNNIDVSKIASKFGGGGHIMAAGCTIDTSDMDDGLEQILNTIKDEYGKKF